MFLPVALTTMIGVVVAFGLLIDDEEAPPLFAEDLREVTESLALQANTFNDMVVGISAVDRVQLESIVDEVTTAIAETRTVMESAPANDPELTGPLAILDQSLTLWQDGATSFEALVLEAADDPLAIGLEIEITDALIDLRAGDRLFQSFVRSIAAADTAQPVVAYPTIQFTSDSYPFSTGPSQIVAVARAEGNGLALRAELAISAVRTVPEMTVNTSDQRVVTATDTLTVQVVVDNGGNTGSEPITLTMSLVGSDDSTIEQTGEVSSLAPGGQTTVEFAGLDVSPGLGYELVVALPLVEGEEATEDNRVQLNFFVNEETATTTTAGG